MNLLFSRKQPPATTRLQVDGRAIEIAVRVSARARSYRLSLTQKGPVLTFPRHGSWPEAEAFLVRHTAWLAARLKRQKPTPQLRDGGSLPIGGVPHRIVGTQRLRGLVERAIDDGPVLMVPGDVEHQQRRIIAWCKAEALKQLEQRSLFHAARLGVTVRSIAMRSQSTRWGSCSSGGRLNYNWRLLLAPPFVLDYVAAHEVAHLVEMNHSPRFWATVERTLPDMARGRAWLKAHGRELMAYGAGA
jgi:predicted metal-dependent hydrolase